MSEDDPGPIKGFQRKHLPPGGAAIPQLLMPLVTEKGGRLSTRYFKRVTAEGQAEEVEIIIECKFPPLPPERTSETEFSIEKTVKPDVDRAQLAAKLQTEIQNKLSSNNIRPLPPTDPRFFIVQPLNLWIGRNGNRYNGDDTANTEAERLTFRTIYDFGGMANIKNEIPKRFGWSEIAALFRYYKSIPEARKNDVDAIKNRYKTFDDNRDEPRKYVGEREEITEEELEKRKKQIDKEKANLTAT